MQNGSLRPPRPGTIRSKLFVGCNSVPVGNFSSADVHVLFRRMQSCDSQVSCRKLLVLLSRILCGLPHMIRQVQAMRVVLGSSEQIDACEGRANLFTLLFHHVVNKSPIHLHTDSIGRAVHRSGQVRGWEELEFCTSVTSHAQPSQSR